MGEFDFWRSLFSATLLTVVLSMFNSMDIEIYWPLLVMYFIMMTVFLCRAKIAHMVRYQYVPWDFGQKKKYKRAHSEESVEMRRDSSVEC